MFEVKIEKLDNLGRGICYVDNKITFVFNALPKEVVRIRLIKETKKYNEAKVIEYIEKDSKRLENICPYFNICGGCHLLHMDYQYTIIYKKNKLQEILFKYANLEENIEVLESPKILSYRNKVTLKVVNGEYGYYETATHKLIKIENCLLAELPIQRFLKDIKYLNIVNGEVVLRSNYNGELLIWIKSCKTVKPNISYLKKNHKIVGIILNDETLIGDNYFVEMINNKFYKVSYDSFFQINRDICEILFNLVEDLTKKSKNILDLYCGVGTLGINTSLNGQRVYGIEIVKNALLNAITNAKINKRNISYLLGDVSKNISKINDEIDTIIVDPPRAGLDKVTKENIIKMSSKTLIYISCNPMSLARDIKDLNCVYDVVSIKGLDMFPFTYHVECVCVLNRR